MTSGGTTDQDLVYRIRISPNATEGNLDLENLVVTDTLETGAVFVGASDGGTEAAGIVTWNLGTLQVSDGNRDLTLTVRYPSTSFSTETRTYYSRFRVCSVAPECEVPTGLADNGEVEDHAVTYDPTAVTVGEVELEVLSVTDVFVKLGVDQMDAAALLALLAVWDPELAAAQSNADRAQLLAELGHFLDSDGDNQVAILRWETLEERGTIGFYVDRWNDDGSWVRINNSMLPGLLAAPMGGEYLLADPEARSGNRYRYQLVEQEAAGVTRAYGPYKLQMP